MVWGFIAGFLVAAAIAILYNAFTRERGEKR